MLVVQGVNRALRVGFAMVLIASCKGEACGVHFEAGGPRVTREVTVRSRGPATEIPPANSDYIGVWRGREVWLAIRANGKVTYYKKDARGPVSIDSAIEAFGPDSFSVGIGPTRAVFKVERPPHLDGADWKMTVDGNELLKTPDYTDLAGKYLNGEGVPKDEGKAADLLAKGCDNDDAFACGLLGAMYEHGEGLAVDLPRAAALMTRACAREDLLSCAILGGYYAKGQGVTRDFAKAEQLVRKACDGGESIGCFNLAVMYDEGQGVTTDDAQAAQLYAKACDRDFGQACQNLALMCEDGEGIPKDPARAMALYGRACQLGLSESCRVAQP